MSDEDLESRSSQSAQHQKPLSGIPAHLSTGTLSPSRPFTSESSSGSGSQPQEGQKLASAIRSTYRRSSLDTSTMRPNGLKSVLHSAAQGQADSVVNIRSEVGTDSASEASLATKTPRESRDDGCNQTSILQPSSSITKAPPVDFDGLSWPSKGTRARLEQTPEQAQARLEKLAGAVRTIFECIGEDPDREGLLNTPDRYAKALMFFTKGYEENVGTLVNNAVFHEDHDELVIVRDIEVFSLCEHHMVPFLGKIHIAYLPDKKVLGLSKLARLAEMFARRLQVQERLTKQVALAIEEVLKPKGVGVVMESTHLCMVMRGVQKSGSVTTTSCMLGALRRDSKTREEFLSLLNRK